MANSWYIPTIFMLLRVSDVYGWACTHDFGCPVSACQLQTTSSTAFTHDFGALYPVYQIQTTIAASYTRDFGVLCPVCQMQTTGASTRVLHCARTTPLTEPCQERRITESEVRNVEAETPGRAIAPSFVLCELDDTCCQNCIRPWRIESIYTHRTLLWVSIPTQLKLS